MKSIARPAAADDTATVDSGLHARSTPPARPSTPAPSTIGGRYRVLCELGRGGMGVVYRVHDPSTDQELALKQLLVRARASQATPAIALFEQEYQTLAQLAHPRVIAVYDYGFDPAGPYYTMELLDGGDLKALAPLDVARSCRLMLELCSSLALLHARRLVHRDISPRNVRCTRDGHAKLIDFGAMVPMGPCTHTVGTPAFVAPEALHRSNIDARTDLFSLGATLYYTLTGRPPFAARQFADLREAWSAELIPPSRIVAGIPPALDALCASLLRIDPAQRPRSAFEVMQRLQAIAGIEHSEPLEVRRAYLTAPALIGRDAPLRMFRQRMRRALHGDGGALAFESAAGLGRSRMLDACALEAKTLGAFVLRAAGSAGSPAPFAVSGQLASELLRALPEAAPAAAEAAGVSAVLFEPSAERSGPARLRSFADEALDRGVLQAALRRWLVQLCQTHALLIAIDDAPRVDEPSIALLAELALEAREQRLLLLITAETAVGAQPRPAFGVLAQHCARAELEPLTGAETEALLASIFDHAPQLPLLADRLHQVALGSPRETLELAQHLVATGRIRYDDGRWTLPAQLSAADLPRNASEALHARIARLPALARSLAQAHALLGNHVLQREHYAALAPHASGAELEDALGTLLEHEVLRRDDERYAVSHRAFADALCASLDDAEARALHLALFALRESQPDSHPYLTVHHLFAAGRDEQALDLLAATPIDDAANVAAWRGDPSRLAATLQHALELALRLARPPREAAELRRRLIALIVMTDDAPYSEVAPELVAQLERDSGLCDYRALDPALPAGERLQRALLAAVARYEATPERERVYRADEAIRLIGNFCTTSVVVIARRLDRRLLLSLPPLITPFAPLSPLLDVLLHNLDAIDAGLFRGHPIEARRGWLQVYERMKDVPNGISVQYAQSIRQALEHAIGRFDASIGRNSAFTWAEKLDTNGMLRGGALQLRRIARLMQGDPVAAEHFAREAELLALRTSGRQMFERPWPIEVLASTLTRDLEGITRAIDGITPIAARHPGWLPLLRLAQGHFHALRGAHGAACDAFEDGMRLASPDHEDTANVDLWVAAAAGLVVARCERGEVEQAIELGTRTLARCEALGTTLVWHKLACALALAEALGGRVNPARARIEALIAEQQQLEIRGLSLAASYEARARIAIAERDAAGAEHYAALAVRERGGQGTLATAVHAERLIEEARTAGLDVTLAPSDFELSVLGTQRASIEPQRSRANSALTACKDALGRAQRALELLSEAAGARGGQLYLADADGRLAHAATRDAPAPDAELARFVQGFFAQQLDDENLSAGLTHATHMLSLPGAASFVDARGREHCLLLLSCKQQGRLVYVGLAVLAVDRSPRVAPELLALSTTLALALLQAGDTAGTRVADSQED